MTKPIHQQEFEACFISEGIKVEYVTEVNYEEPHALITYSDRTLDDQFKGWCAAYNRIPYDYIEPGRCREWLKGYEIDKHGEICCPNPTCVGCGALLGVTCWAGEFPHIHKYPFEENNCPLCGMREAARSAYSLISDSSTAKERLAKIKTERAIARQKALMECLGLAEEGTAVWTAIREKIDELCSPH